MWFVCCIRLLYEFLLISLGLKLVEQAQQIILITFIRWLSQHLCRVWVPRARDQRILYLKKPILHQAALALTLGSRSNATVFFLFLMFLIFELLGELVLLLFLSFLFAFRNHFIYNSY